MTQGEKYRAEAQRLDAQANDALKEADGLVIGIDDVPPEIQKRADEKYAQVEKLYERSGFYRSRAADADARDLDQRSADAELGRNAWKERATGSGSPVASDLNDAPGLLDLQHRSRELALRLRGESYNEDVAARSWPVEGLYPRVLRGIVKPDNDPEPLTVEERRAWQDYCVLATRALAPTQKADTANLGGTLVPENMANRIFAASKLYGGFSDMVGLAQFTQRNPGSFKAPTEETLVDTDPSRVAEGADVPIKTVRTNEVDIPLNNFAIQVVLTDAVLMSDNLSLEAYLVSRMGRQFGKQINLQVTNGSGTNQAKGVGQIAAGRQVAVATDGTIAEDDIYNLLKRLDGSYHGLPTTRAHAHFNTILDIVKLRDNGVPAFNRTPDGLNVVLPGGATIVPNNALSEPSGADTAATKLMLLGDHMEYAIVRDGPLRFERARELRSFQWLLSWNMFLGGAPVIEDAWAVLTGKA